MADQTYRVAIVGAGQHVVYTSDVHSLRDDPSIPVRDTVEAGHAASLALIPNVQVVGICDVDPERTEHFRRTWSGRWLDLRTYSDHQEMLHSEEIDILTVATPEHLHAEVAVNAANAGVKGILCEKPIATSLSDADRIIEACEANGVALTVNHTKRWTALYHEVREAIRGGTIGPVTTIVANMSGNKMLFRDGTHVIDAVCFFAESDPVRVSAVLEEGFDSWDRYRGIGSHDEDAEPGASGFIQFANGIRALYSGTGGAFPGNVVAGLGAPGPGLSGCLGELVLRDDRSRTGRRGGAAQPDTPPVSGPTHSGRVPGADRSGRERRRGRLFRPGGPQDPPDHIGVLEVAPGRREGGAGTGNGLGPVRDRTVGWRRE